MLKQAQAKLRYLRMSPRKVRLVVDIIRGLKVNQAIIQLESMNKTAVRPVLKLLKSAVANAKHNHILKEETLIIKKAHVDGGPILDRWQPRAMGRATPIRKRTSHIVIVLEGEVDEKTHRSAGRRIYAKADKASSPIPEGKVGKAGEVKENTKVKGKKIKSKIKTESEKDSEKVEKKLENKKDKEEKKLKLEIRI